MKTGQSVRLPPPTQVPAALFAPIIFRGAAQVVDFCHCRPKAATFVRAGLDWQEAILSTMASGSSQVGLAVYSNSMVAPWQLS